MTRRLAAFGVGVLILAIPVWMNGCASNVDDPSDSDSVLRVDTITPATLTAAVAGDEFVVAQVSATPMGGAKNTTLNDVVLDTYTVFYDPPLSGSAGLRYSTTLVVKSGGSASLSVIAIPSGLKPVSPAPGTFTATIQVEGHDTLGNPASASGKFMIIAP
jgi:hypothetical protein